MTSVLFLTLIETLSFVIADGETCVAANGDITVRIRKETWHTTLQPDYPSQLRRQINQFLVLRWLFLWVILRILIFFFTLRFVPRMFWRPLRSWSLSRRSWRKLTARESWPCRSFLSWMKDSQTSGRITAPDHLKTCTPAPPSLFNITFLMLRFVGGWY